MSRAAIHRKSVPTDGYDPTVWCGNCRKICDERESHYAYVCPKCAAVYTLEDTPGWTGEYECSGCGDRNETNPCTPCVESETEL